MKRIAMLLVASLLAGSSTPTPPPTASCAHACAPASSGGAGASAAARKACARCADRVTHAGFERMRMGLADQSIYFDFDKYAIKPEYTWISEHAKLGNSYSNDYLTLQGNCDERGSREYNLALGQRRADAVW